MSGIVESIVEEYRRYKALGEGALGQLEDDELCAAGPGESNSPAVMVWHLAGNLASRFTDFLTTDGEKPWRRRDEEFVTRSVRREALLEKWQHGWGILFAALEALTDEDLQRTVTIRRVPMRVHEALHRSLAHAAYHVGQLVYLARALRGDAWRYLSIPPGGSEAYNRNPTRERAADYTAAVERRSGKG